MTQSNPVDGPRCGMIAVVGRTNSGKSTLFNQVLGEKVSIVSPVVQTTRNVIRGIYTEDRGQLVLIDTPGLHQSQGHLGSRMNRMARGASKGTDMVLLIMDASEHPHLEDEGWMRRLLKQSEQPLVFYLNKLDKARRHVDEFKVAWDTMRRETGIAREAVWIEGAALSGDGVEALKTVLFDALPVSSDYLFPETMLTDFPRKLAIGDVIREKFNEFLLDELPHAIGIRVNEIRASADRWHVDVTIFVHRHSQKVIVIGHKGRGIRRVKRKAEHELSEIFEVKVSLRLWVKIEPKWDSNFFLLREMGYAESS